MIAIFVVHAVMDCSGVDFSPLVSEAVLRGGNRLRSRPALSIGGLRRSYFFR